MSPFDLLQAIEVAYTKPGRFILELRAPTVLGIRGRYLREDEYVDPETGATFHTGSLYGFTRRQCRKMKRIIHEAARADLEGR